MARPDHRQALTLLATVLALWLILGFSGATPWRAAALCTLVLLVAGIILWMQRRRLNSVALKNDDALPPETYSGPVILVCGDSALLFGSQKYRENRQGWYLNVGEPEQLTALAEQFALQRPALLPQLSVMMAIVPERHMSEDGYTQQQSAWQYALLRCKRSLKRLPPLWTVVWVSPLNDRGTHWYYTTPEQPEVQVYLADHVSLSPAAWFTQGNVHLHDALWLQSLMKWHADRHSQHSSLMPCRIGYCLTAVTSLPDNLWQQHVINQTALSFDSASVPVTLPFPDLLLVDLPRRQGVSLSMRTARYAGLLGSVFLILAMLSSFVHNQRLIRSVEDHLHLWRNVPDTSVAAKTLARDQLIRDRIRLDEWQRSGAPLQFGLGLYQGMRLIAPVNAAIHHWAPPPPSAPVIQQSVKGPQTVRLDSLSLFESGKAALKAGSDKVLINALVGIKAKPGWLIVVAGHTDSTGNLTHNQTLSLKRAEAVRNWMRDTGDVEESCFAVQGYGQSRPIATNDTMEGRSLNRRVEISLIPQANACRVLDVFPLPSQDDGNSQFEME